MEALLLHVVNRSLAASGLILAVMALRLLLRRAPRRLLCLLWALVALRLLCPVLPVSPWSLAPNARTIPADIAQSSPPQIHSGIALLNSTVNPALAQAFPSRQTLPEQPAEGAAAEKQAVSRPRQPGSRLGPLAWGWMAGAGLLAGYGLAAAWLLSRRMKEACLERGNIYRSDRADSPFVLGLLRPRIYLPWGMAPQTAGWVIAHEQSHIRRGDHWAKALGWLLVCLHWFNPLAWAAYRLLCRDLELACDERVIRRMDRNQIAGYAQALLECSRPRPVPGMLSFGRLGVKGRVKYILQYRRPACWMAPATLLACGLAAFFWLTEPGQPPALPVESNVLSVSLCRGEESRLVQDRQQIQGVLAALGQARASGKKRLGESPLELWLDDGSGEANCWKLDSRGLLQGPQGQVYRLDKGQAETLEEAWRQGEPQPSYTLARLSYGKAGQQIRLTPEQADIARQSILQSLLISAAFPGRPPEQLPECWRIQAGSQAYYIYMAEGRPVFQNGQMYTVLSRQLYEKLEKLTGWSLEGQQPEETAPPRLMMPVEGQVTQAFGRRAHPVTGRQADHSGMDIAALHGAPVLASADGRVAQAGWEDEYGNVVVIDHGGGLETLYAHNSRLLVEQGQQVSQGQQIALAGNTGSSTGSHCHWEVRLQGQPVDPMEYVTDDIRPGQFAQPMTWAYEPAISSRFPALPLAFDPVDLDAGTEEAVEIQVSCNTGTFYRHDESQVPNYQDLGQTARYRLGQVVYWAPDLENGEERANTTAHIAFRVGGSRALMEGELLALPHRPDSGYFETYELSLESAQPLTLSQDGQTGCFLVQR